jgi:hypothetical protein
LTSNVSGSRLALLYSKGQDVAQQSRATAPNRDDQLSLGFDETGADDLGLPERRIARRKLDAGERDLSTRPQTRLKLDSLAAYLPQWFGIASNQASDTYYVDAFAGAGHYPDGAGPQMGRR